MLRDIPEKIKIKGHEILISVTGDYTCDAFCRTQESFCLSEEFSVDKRKANDEAYLDNYENGVISYRNIMWDCWERLEKRLRNIKIPQK